MSGIPDVWHPETVYLNTASFGLPPDSVWDALQVAQADWRAGRVSWEHWTAVTGRARNAVRDARARRSRQRGGGRERLRADRADRGRDPRRLEVLAPEPEFTSLLFPFLAQAERGVDGRRRAARPAGRGDRRAARTSSPCRAVQSSTGEVAALDDIASAARHHGALSIIDATHAIGWLPVDATRFDALACAAYKWLMSPRGTAFMVLDEALADRLTPHQAGWFAANDPLTDQFGPPLRLPETARRFDTSPAWFSWVGTEPALQLLNEIGVETIHAARPQARQPLLRRPRPAGIGLRDRHGGHP